MKYKLDEMKLEELEETLELVKKVFNEFEVPDYTTEGVENFYKFANYNNIKEQLSQNMKIIVAKEEKQIIGMIAFRDYSHISMLFVDKNYHRQGIATELVKIAKLCCRNNNKSLSCITVNSSPYAVKFYCKLGFENTNSEQIVDGIKFTPMKLDIYNFKKYEEKDFDYLYKTKKDCFKWYVEKLYGDWDDEIQIKFFKDEINIENTNVITYKNNTIGIFTNYIGDNNESVIGLFYIDKKYQGKGIGTEILEEQLIKDKKNKRDTILKVYKKNPARFLYQKVGFETYDETSTHYLMKRKFKD